MAKVQEKTKAIELRKLGYSYKEILGKIPNIAKSTLSHWCNAVELTPKQIENIRKRTKEKIDQGRLKAAIVNRKKRRNDGKR